MKMSLRLTGDGLTRALRRLSHKVAEVGEAARRAERKAPKSDVLKQERDDARRRV
ncbi:hypothetical protein ACFPOD_02525 [Nitratireductor kimnyeongensis]|uniref:Uncharacterized protein n=1 Tax=Nitratireductor kimnyeongensis TaxID=430679 RepID=A0ABW0T5R7_9HYPH|nr:hypothetical protein [Nitratireductor kimnyeongensis]QZZ35009.1 hypothetical protein KW403_14665 [Nitratireductor kimnyeongensis]